MDAGVITRFSNDALAPLELRDGAFCPGKSDLERACPPTADPRRPEIDSAKGIKNGRFFKEGHLSDQKLSQL